jgi:hypothetical protein
VELAQAEETAEEAVEEAAHPTLTREHGARRYPGRRRSNFPRPVLS